jgi:AraC family transcriptional regulator, positive regulator of tynA and feaB
VVVDGELIGEGLPYEAWRDVVRERCGRYDFESDHVESFSGSIRTKNVCGLEAVDLRCNLHSVSRTYQDARRDGIDRYKLVFQAAGRSMLNQNDRATRVGAGDIAFVDLSRPVTYIYEDEPTRQVVLYLPRRSMVNYLSLEPQGGVTWQGETSVVARALFRLVLDTLEQGDPSPASAEAYMQFAVYDLFAALCAASGSGPAWAHSEKLFARACQVIKNAFRDPDAGPNQIAAETGISVRYLQKLFSSHGLTCAGVIRSHRLEHAVHLLQRRTTMKAWQSLSEIAYASGFRDYNAFYQTFRRQFGTSPGTTECKHGRTVRNETSS